MTLLGLWLIVAYVVLAFAVWAFFAAAADETPDDETPADETPYPSTRRVGIGIEGADFFQELSDKAGERRLTIPYRGARDSTPQAHRQGT